MEVLKIAAAIMLALLLGAAGWTLTHLRKIKRNLIANDLMPKPIPRQNFLFRLTADFLGVSALPVAVPLH